MTHIYGDHDGQHMGNAWTRDGPLTVDPFIIAVLALETVNFALLAYVIYWTVRAGDRIINRLAQSVGLQRGKNPSILSGVRAHFAPRLPKPAGEPLEGEIVPANGGPHLDLSNVSMDQLKGLAQQYLGGQMGQTDNTGVQLAQKFLEGSLTQKDLTGAIPFFLKQIRMPNGQAQLAGPSSVSRWD